MIKNEDKWEIPELCSVLEDRKRITSRAALSPTEIPGLFRDFVGEKSPVTFVEWVHSGDPYRGRQMFFKRRMRQTLQPTGDGVNRRPSFKRESLNPRE